MAYCILATPCFAKLELGKHDDFIALPRGKAVTYNVTDAVSLILSLTISTLFFRLPLQCYIFGSYRCMNITVVWFTWQLSVWHIYFENVAQLMYCSGCSFSWIITNGCVLLDVDSAKSLPQWGWLHSWRNWWDESKRTDATFLSFRWAWYSSRYHDISHSPS